MQSVQKEFHYFVLFFFFSPGFGNDDVSPTLFSSSDLTLAQETTVNIVFRSFFILVLFSW